MQILFKRLLNVSKPGIVMGNALHVLAGSLLAFLYGLDYLNVLGVLVGTSLLIASACAVNNWLDRHIDAKMKRTKRREVVKGVLSQRQVYVYAAVAFVLGMVTLYFTTNSIVVAVGIVSYIMYVWVYGYFKRRTPWGTLVGSVPGSLPVVAGYVAVSGSVDLYSIVLFVLIVAWQMVHFYAIAIFRKDEYAAASVPVITVVRSEDAVKTKLIIWGIVYILVLGWLVRNDVFGQYTGGIMLGFGLWWCAALFYKSTPSIEKWARRIFYRSLVLPYVMVLCGIVTVVLG